MATMMQHPKHGKHPATGHEVEYMKAQGWTICPPKVKEAAPVVALDASDHPADMAPAPRRRGPNKPKG